MISESAIHGEPGFVTGTLKKKEKKTRDIEDRSNLGKMATGADARYL